eukprot:COSAG05_NODE_398_length_10293_cov_11.919176_11_plen_52_part_00
MVVTRQVNNVHAYVAAVGNRDRMLEGLRTQNAQLLAEREQLRAAHDMRVRP